MEQRRLTIISIGILVLAGLVSFLYLSEHKTQNQTLTIAFLDVGQGDAIFIETPSGNQILIDGGPNGTVLSELGRVMPPGDRTIDMVIATHPDADHIAGLVDVLDRYQVDTFIDSGAIAKTAIFEALSDQELNVPRSITAHIGDRIVSDDGVTLDILAPYSNPNPDDMNASSVVTLLRYGTLSVMLTGDAPQEIEEDLTRWYGNQLESEILKAGHHGSKTSTDPKFVQALDPVIGIISAGADNRYGHPNKDVVDTLTKEEVQILGTYEEGTIIFESDGKNLWRK